MPELPEVEVVRRGLTPYVLGATITDVAVEHPAALGQSKVDPPNS